MSKSDPCAACTPKKPELSTRRTPAAIVTKRERVSRQLKPMTRATMARAANSDGSRTAQLLAPNNRTQPAISQISSGGLVLQTSG